MNARQKQRFLEIGETVVWVTLQWTAVLNGAGREEEEERVSNMTYFRSKNAVAWNSLHIDKDEKL